MTEARQLDVEGLRFGGVGPVDLWLAPRECLALGGPSGAGKSRLLRAIADLDVHEGRVACQGTTAEALEPSEWRRRVGMLAADSRWWRDRVDEHFAAPPAGEMLEALALDEALLRAPVAKLSSGERQRFALLRLLANHPRVLLLDEPTANLDPDNALRVEHLIADYRRSEGAAVLWVSHDPQQMRRVADRRLRLEGGRLVQAPDTEPIGDAPR
ncbi:MAG: ATP-binding cassette domain-containing protein [Gammaproteobacteria bacterium]|nr:ATP-binding cassette domain-containing protein [Gammaproteobacteria bacterium]NIM73803.1 ATP-binding cassette domain-containing protein [Gammaproteobacteria bacterium]NIN39380.1 ATP-binding cassette domain-containing protein [Gammaproteobacteria bacterium]NIO25045.1 ATP-binding cassette domain-containing protein [Gammaproteobacteria bacterium]NIO65677.1 ATP-binding cassette domain-containing protein [Gammaproteobacteria bacterium]